MDSTENWRLAALLVNEHGGDATAIASARREKALTEHNPKDFETWTKITAIIGQIIHK